MIPKKILLVEDERDVRTIATVALEKVAGFEVMACASGEEGCRAFPGFDPDIVLLDVMMPGMDGVQTMESIRTLMTRPVPIIFVTAKAQKPEVARFKELGATEVFTKPFDPMTIGQLIRDVWTRFQQK